MLHEHAVVFALTDAQETRLMAITARINRLTGGSRTMDGILAGMVLTGSANMIDGRMDGMEAALNAAEAQEGDCHVCRV